MLLLLLLDMVWESSYRTCSSGCEAGRVSNYSYDDFDGSDMESERRGTSYINIGIVCLMFAFLKLHSCKDLWLEEPVGMCWNYCVVLNVK